MFPEYIETFLALATSKNYTQAADRLYISQSSLTKRIQKLESLMGVQLFKRTTKSVELTFYGEIYADYAHQINNLQIECNRKINTALTQNKNLIIGSIPSIGQYEIIDLISDFIKISDIHCQIITRPSGKLEDLLRTHQLDFAFIREVKNTQLFKKVPYTTDHMVAVLPKHHRLANKKQLSISMLNNENFLLPPLESRPYNLCVSLCEHAGFKPNVVYTDSQMENIIDFVGTGMGISLLMSKLVGNSKNVVSVPIKPEITTDIDVCYRDDAELSDAQNHFLNYFKHNEPKFQA
ncbi:LysR family transcriptional regulator [Pediococcus ethanolidurans]|uniref:LysR family transcriptional regulator n=1 Tax=Pediococcus ethanolidurans TaxID=319653 RepID=UPI002953276C|nr:LysR family transcriptional regulator [Pediococcus ethanolidurans]MDV7718379.1 LysR family transcriptional regulator [Pediococcus ethanolidurans]